MVRDDSLLYSGMSSASFRRNQEQKEKQKEAKEAKRAELVPKAELVFAEIERERKIIAAELGNIIHIDMAEQDVKATVLGLRLADQRLMALSTRLSNMLRKPKTKKKADDADV